MSVNHTSVAAGVERLVPELAPGWLRLRPAILASQVVVLVALASLVAWRVDLDGAGRVLASAAWPLLAAALLANAASATLKAMTWQGLVGGLGGVGPRGCRRIDLVGPFFVGAMLNAVTPLRAGELARALLARRALRRRGARVSLAGVAGSMLAERMFTTTMWGPLAVALAWLTPMPAPARWGVSALALGALGITVAAALCPPAARSPRPGRSRSSRAAAEAWSCARESFGVLRRPRGLLALTAVGLGHWLTQWAAIALMLWALGLGHVGLGGAGMVLVALSLAAAVPGIAGLGAVPAAAVLALSGLYGVEPAGALVFGLLVQSGEKLVNVGLGLGFAAGAGVGLRAVLARTRAGGLDEAAHDRTMRGGAIDAPARQLAQA